MRSVSWFLLGIGLVVSQSSSWAQEAPLPKVQVVIGADGSVKVFDAKTGKELPSRVTKAEKRVLKVEDVQKEEAQKPLEQARQHLEKLLRDQQKAKAEKPKPKEIEIELLLPRKKAEAEKPKPKEIEIEFHFTPDDGKKARVIAVEKVRKVVQQAGSVDQKLDLLLRQMEELRRDVNQLKNKLEGKKPDVLMWKIISNDGKEKGKKPEAPRIQLKPPPPRGADKNVDADTLKRIDELIRKLEAEQREKIKKAASDLQTPRPVDRNVDLEQRLERALREVELHHRELLERKSAK